MRRVNIDSEWINQHRAAYSAVTREIVDLLSNGENVSLGSCQSLDIVGISWAKDYFKMLKTIQDSNDLLIATPDILQRAITKEEGFLISVGYCKKEGRICVDKALPKDEQERRRSALRNVRNLCSRIFDYDLFVHAETYESDRANHNYNRIKTKNGWGGDSFREVLNVKYCLYCNIDDVLMHNLERDIGGERKDSVAHTGFDHYFEKSLYPYLALSIYNLIPCCDRCNQKYKTQAIMDISRHSHPYVHDFHSLMEFDVEFDKLRQIQGVPKEVPLTLKKRGRDSREENLADGFSKTIGLCSIYRHRAVDETMHVVRVMDQRLSDFQDYNVRRKDKYWIARRNTTDFMFDLSAEEINGHRCAKLTSDLVDAYCRRCVIV